MQSYLTPFKDSRVRKLIFSWMFSWLAIAGGTIYVLPTFGADQYHNVHITFSYFMVFAVGGFIYFGLKENFSHHVTIRQQLLWVVIITALQFVICLAFDKILPLSETTFNHIVESKFYFPLFSLSTLFAKLSDIFFQQVFIFGLIKSLKKMELSDENVIVVFSSAFFGVHLPLIFSLKFYALFFIIPSSFAGLFFALAILKNRRGLALSVFIHEFFYVLLGVVLRLS